jgi:hypothetical protein
LFEDGKIDSNPFDSGSIFYKQLKKGKVLKENVVASDKASITTTNYNVEKKAILINKMLYFIFNVVGVKKFFLLTRLMRLYSKTENHIYLIDKSYFKNFKFRS